ncbi:MAG: type II secretion system protein GspJ [Bdellovibrionales bacterium]
MRNTQAGFTLLELIIAIAIFAILSAFTANSIQNGVRAKQKIQTQIDEVSRMRDALKLLERDLNLAYHHLDWEREVLQLVRQKSMQPGQVAQPELPAEAPRLDPSTHFVGDDKSIHFVTMNNARFQTDKKLADFVEVGYSLKACRSADGKTNSQCLWRRQSGPVDLDVTRGGDELVLLEHVTELRFRYLGQGKQDWVTDWNSTDQSNDALERAHYPLAVEISLTTQKGDKGKKHSMQIVANIHFPNNPVPQQQGVGQQGAPGITPGLPGSGGFGP